MCLHQTSPEMEGPQFHTKVPSLCGVTETQTPALAALGPRALEPERHPTQPEALPLWAPGEW